MQIRVILKLLALLTLANGTPVMAKNILRDYTAHPLDGGLRFFDGRPLFGPSKTIRGIVLSLLVTSAGAPLLGLPWKLGALVAALAMTGDLFPAS